MYSIPGSDYNEMSNPRADLSLPGVKYNNDRFVMNLDAELTLWDALKFKSSVGIDLGFSGEDGWTPNYCLNANRKQDYSSVYSTMRRGLIWQVENTLSYDKTFNDKHQLTVMLGQSALESTGRSLTGSNQNLMEEDPGMANLGFATGDRNKQGASGYLYADYRLASLDCSDNLLTGLDLGALANLTSLDCANNHLAELSIKSNPQLTVLDCTGNPIERIYVWAGFKAPDTADYILPDMFVPEGYTLRWSDEFDGPELNAAN